MTKKHNQHIEGAYVNNHTKCEVSMIMCMGRRANQRKVPKWLPFENISQNNLKSNQHIAEINMNIHKI